MEPYRIIELTIYLASFGLSLYALSGIRFDVLCYSSKPLKVQVLLVLLAIGLAYVVAQFLLALTIYH